MINNLFIMFIGLIFPQSEWKLGSVFCLFCFFNVSPVPKLSSKLLKREKGRQDLVQLEALSTKNEVAKPKST